MIQLREQYWAVEVPDKAKYHRIDGVPNGAFYELIFYKDSDDIDFPDEIQDVKIIDLPPGTWEIVCTSKEATEDKLLDVVRELPVGQRFENYCGDYPVWYHSRKEPLRSLLASKGCDMNKNWLILKKQ